VDFPLDLAKLAPSVLPGGTGYGQRQPGVTDRRGSLRPRNKKDNGSEPLGFEAVLWEATDKLRGSMDANEYKHIVLAPHDSSTEGN
jgi:hypothetical protein